MGPTLVEPPKPDPEENPRPQPVAEPHKDWATAHNLFGVRTRR